MHRDSPPPKKGALSLSANSSRRCSGQTHLKKKKKGVPCPESGHLAVWRVSRRAIRPANSQLRRSEREMKQMKRTKITLHILRSRRPVPTPSLKHTGNLLVNFMKNVPFKGRQPKWDVSSDGCRHIGQWSKISSWFVCKASITSWSWARLPLKASVNDPSLNPLWLQSMSYIWEQKLPHRTKTLCWSQNFTVGPI